MNLNYLIKKINEIISLEKYHGEYYFEPLKIRFNIATPIMLSYPFIFFDGLIAHIKAKDVLGEYFDLLPQRIPINFVDNLDLPIKRTNINSDYLYHASISIFEDPTPSINIIHRQFSGDLVNQYTQSIKKRNIDLSRGKFKLYQMRMPVNNSKYVDFYCNGDKKELERLCRYVEYIGKKRSIGYGSVLSFEIEKLKEDYSIIKDNKIMRPVPLIFCPMFNIKNQDNIAMMNYKPPYWDKSSSKLCVIPEIGNENGFEE